MLCLSQTIHISPILWDPLQPNCGAAASASAWVLNTACFGFALSGSNALLAAPLVRTVNPTVAAISSRELINEGEADRPMSSMISIIHDASRLRDLPPNHLLLFWRESLGSASSSTLQAYRHQGYG